MPLNLHAVAKVRHTNGLGKDDQQFSFAIMNPSAVSNATVLARVIAGLNSMFELETGGVSLSTFLASHFSRASNAHEVNLYNLDGNLDGEPHGSPVATGLWTLEDAASGISLPSEVTSKITLRGEDWDSVPVEAPDGPDAGTAVDRPRGRHTGGFFLPSLNVDASDTSVGGISRPKATFRTAALQGVDALSLALRNGGTLPCFLAVWSRSDEVLHEAVAAQMDNAWDTQRPRGVAPTLRETVDLTN